MKVLIDKYKTSMIWSKQNLFQNPLSSFLSLIFLGLFLKFVWFLFKWLVIESVWNGTAEDCRVASGACLAFLKEKARFIIFGIYPYEEHWRLVLILLLFFAFLFYIKNWKRFHKLYTPILTVIFLATEYALMKGGVFGLITVETHKWSGLPLTLLLATFGIVLSYPLGILLALARTSLHTPLLKMLAVMHIELIRGVPLISVLFMSSVLFPLFLPAGVHFDKLLRAQIAIILFMSAYMAEVVRGGLSSIPSGQYEAAKTLGLNSFQTLRYIVLPQALKTVIAPTVNTAIGMLKDTSLVLIISLFDLLNTTKAALKDPHWQGFIIEAYMFTALIYFIMCFSLATYSRKIEKKLSYENI